MKGLIFHKPINLGPLRINVSKTGIENSRVGFSLSLGPFGRVGRNVLGKWYYDVTIINILGARIRFRRNLDAPKEDMEE